MIEKKISEKRMSFLPEDYVESRIERRTTLVCLVLFVAVLAGVVGSYAFASQQRAEVRKEGSQINAAYTEAAQRLEQLDSLQSRKSEMLRRAQVTATLLEKVPRTFLMADLVNRMPEPLSLMELELHSRVIQPPRTAPSRTAMSSRGGRRSSDEDKTPPPPPVPQSVVSLVMIGVAPTDVQVAQYMTELAQSPLLSDVTLIFTEEVRIAETLMRRFRIEMVLDSTADIRAMDPPVQPDRPRDPLRDAAALPGLRVLPGRGSAPALKDGARTRIQRPAIQTQRAED